MKAIAFSMVFTAMAGCSSSETMVAGKRVDVLLTEQTAYFWKDGRLVRRLPIVSGQESRPKRQRIQVCIASTKRIGDRKRLLPASLFATS